MYDHAHPSMHRHSQLCTNHPRNMQKRLVCQREHAHWSTQACAICKTSPSQPKDKGAVVAWQQVSLAPTHLKEASAQTIAQ